MTAPSGGRLRVAARRFRASASRTSGLPLARTASSRPRAQGPVPRPGPIATTVAAASGASRVLVSAAPRQISSGRFATMAVTFSGAVSTVTSPAPQRRQASPARRAAPAMPGPPAISSTRPKSPLCAARGRAGRACAMSVWSSHSSSGRAAAPAGGRNCRSSQYKRPTNSGPTPTYTPHLGPALAQYAQGCGTGALHQRIAGDAELVDRPRVEGTHLGDRVESAGLPHRAIILVADNAHADSRIAARPERCPRATGRAGARTGLDRKAHQSDRARGRLVLLPRRDLYRSGAAGR